MVALQSSIPAASRLIERDHLLTKLQGVLEHRLTLITAPPGYGKSTIAAQFVQEVAIPAAWHTVDERERDVPNLYLHCLSALASILPGIQSLKSTFQGHSPGEIAALIANFLRENMPQEFLYILDDVHHLTGSPAAETWLRTLIGLLPPGCHVMIISRTLPDLPLTEMIARREVLALGQEALRFTTQEIQILAQNILGTPLASAKARALETRMGGWPAGIILALQPLPPELEQAVLSGTDAPEALFESLASAMLESQPPDFRGFLLASSTLALMTPELCAKVLHLTSSEEWLAKALKDNLFLSRVPGGLAYHHLFRNFLQWQLKHQDADLFARLHTGAARWFEEHEDIDRAIEHYLDAGLDENAAGLAEKVAQSYFAMGKIETLLRWRDYLRHMHIPNLLHMCAVIHINRYEYDTALQEIELAEKAFAQGGNHDALIELQLQKTAICLRAGDYHAAVAQAEQLKASYPTRDRVYAKVLHLLGVACLHLGEVDSAAICLEEAVLICRAFDDAYVTSTLLQDLEAVYTRSGRLDEAAICLQEVVTLRRSIGNTGALALALNNLGYHYYIRGEYQQAQATLQEGLSIIAQFPNRRGEGYLLWNMSDLMRDCGSFEKADGLYSRALEMVGNNEPTMKCSILISMAFLRRWQGRHPDALLLAVEALVLANRHSLVIEGYLAEAIRLVALAQVEDKPVSIEALKTIADSLIERHFYAEALRVLALCASVALTNEDEQAAEMALNVADSISNNGMILQPVAAEAVHHPMLLRFVNRYAFRFEALLTTIKNLDAARRQMTPVVPEIEYPTYSLRIQALGRESVERDGKTVSPSAWRSARARELFFYLLFKGPTGREQISLEFWPDSSTEQVRSNFHTTLHRTRKALGENAIVFQDGNYLINPDLHIWCDVHQFESLVKQARVLSPHHIRAEELWRKAVNLYRGDFLPSLDADWTMSYREYLVELYMEALMGLGKCAQVRRRYADAIAVFKQALRVDPYREAVHRAVLVCYSEQSEREKLIGHFHDLEKLLNVELGVKPSRETQELVLHLLS